MSTLQLLFIVAILFILCGVATYFGTRDIERKRRLIRLARATATEETTSSDFIAARVAAVSLVRRVAEPIVTTILSMAARIAPIRIRATMQKRLERAGVPYGLNTTQIIALKLILMIVGLVGGMLTFSSMVQPVTFEGVFIYVALTTAFGWFLIDMWLSSCARKYRQAAALALPDVVDLLDSVLRAGNGFDQGLDRIIAQLENPLTIELRTYRRQRMIGKSSTEALEAMADRLNDPMIRRFTEQLILAGELGNGFSKVLRAYSDSLRTERWQLAETKAAQATIKMLFPLVLFIFPAIFIMVLGPSIPSFMHGL